MMNFLGRQVCAASRVKSYVSLGRYYGSRTKDNIHALRSCVMTRNHVSLVSELQRISSTFKSNGSISTSDNLGDIVARLCVRERAADMNLAFEILECLDEIKPTSMASGISELVDKCLDFGHVDDAVTAYMRLHNMNIPLNSTRKERLISVLASRCRLFDLVVVLTDHELTEIDLSVCAEPLIMAGKVKIYAELLREYLDRNRNTADPLQCPEDVARVTRSIMAARLRRFFDSTEPSEDENTGMLDILNMIQLYHIQLQCIPSSNDLDKVRSKSYFQSRQLCEIEKERGMEMALGYPLSSHQLELIDHLPEFDASDFPYVAEGSGQLHIEPLHRLRIKDLTAELKRKDPNRILLYDKDLFPEAFDMACAYLQQRSVVMAVKSIMERTGLFVDAVPADTEDSDTYVTPSDASFNPSGHSVLKPPFKLHDISETLQLRNPPVYLLFNNDMFDRRHGVEADHAEFLESHRIQREKEKNMQKEREREREQRREREREKQRNLKRETLRTTESDTSMTHDLLTDSVTSTAPSPGEIHNFKNEEDEEDKK